MNTKQLQYVITLAHEGSFSRAADTLNITQPSLSQYIKKIEKQIGLELFDRTNGDVRLTDAGRVYIDTGRKILDLEHRMENSFTDLASGLPPVFVPTSELVKTVSWHPHSFIGLATS